LVDFALQAPNPIGAFFDGFMANFSVGHTLFVFLDESGNFDFSPNGSKFWSLTALCTLDPVEDRHKLTELLYELAAAGGGQECFHATEDFQSVRDEVFTRINQLPPNFEIHSVIADKRKANPVIYEEHVSRGGKKHRVTSGDGMYERVARTLLKYIFNRPKYKYKHAKRIVVVLSSLFDKSRHKALTSVLNTYLKGHTGMAFFIYFHATKADMNCQIADYCCWAISIKYERGETRSYDLIKHHIKSEFEIFKLGDTTYY
jgi:hypothetical protein